MKYLQTKERDRKKVLSAFLFGALLIFFFYFFRSDLLNILTSGSLRLLGPFWKAEETLSDRMSEFFVSLKDKQDLATENKKIKNDLALFRTQILENELIKEENSELRKLLGREEIPGGFEKQFGASKPVNENLELGFVLSGPATPPYDSLIIDVGSKNGIQRGDVVIDPSNSAVGEIVEVFSEYSKIKLFSSYGQKIFSIAGDKKTMIEISGLGGGSFGASLPGDFSISVGDGVYLPGSDGRIVALVGSIQKEESASFKKIVLRSVSNPKELRLVGVIKKS